MFYGCLQMNVINATNLWISYNVLTLESSQYEGYCVTL